MTIQDPLAIANHPQTKHEDYAVENDLAHLLRLCSLSHVEDKVMRSLTPRTFILIFKLLILFIAPVENSKIKRVHRMPTPEMTPVLEVKGLKNAIMSPSGSPVLKRAKQTVSAKLPLPNIDIPKNEKPVGSSLMRRLIPNLIQ